MEYALVGTHVTVKNALVGAHVTLDDAQVILEDTPVDIHVTV